MLSQKSDQMFKYFLIYLKYHINPHFYTAYHFYFGLSNPKSFFCCTIKVGYSLNSSCILLLDCGG